MDVENGFQNYINDMPRELKADPFHWRHEPVLPHYVLPPLISHFNEQYPGSPESDGATTSERERLFSGSLDFLIDNRSMDPAVYSKRFSVRTSASHGSCPFA